MDKICPRCNHPFNCKHDDIFNCHCISVVLDANQLGYIQRNYNGCLCHSCLLEIKDAIDVDVKVPYRY